MVMLNNLVEDILSSDTKEGEHEVIVGLSEQCSLKDNTCLRDEHIIDYLAFDMYKVEVPIEKLR